MRCALSLIAVLLPVSLMLAQEETKPLTPEEALTKINEKVTVQMEVKSSGGGNTTRYLNSMADYKDRNNFAIIIFRSDLAPFIKAGIDDPAVYYKGKTIRVTGTVSTYRGQVQIKVDDPQQIKVIDKDAEQPKAKPSRKAVKGNGKPK